MPIWGPFDELRPRPAEADHIRVPSLAPHKDNQTFLHTRFGLGGDILTPYKETLDRWLWPDVTRNQDASVIKAKQAISSFKKAVGECWRTARKIANEEATDDR